MKTNAIIRICIYSVLILILLAVLASAFMFGLNWRPFRHLDSADIGAVSSINPSGVSRIGIEWAAGDIVIQRGRDNTINISESASGNDRPMVCRMKNDKLEIQFTENKPFSFGFGNIASKDLTVTVPEDFDLRELELDMASGNVEIRDLTIDEVEFDCADVECVLDGCTVRTLDVDTASGDITFSGSLEELDLDSASTDFVGVFTNTPRSITMDGMSGKLDLTLPEKGGFSARIDGMSNHFSSEYPTQTVNGAYVWGDGFCRIDVDGMSSDVTIRKGEK